MEEGIEVSLNVTASPEEDTSRYTLKLCLSIAYFALWIIGSIGNGLVLRLHTIFEKKIRL